MILAGIHPALSAQQAQWASTDAEIDALPPHTIAVMVFDEQALERYHALKQAAVPFGLVVKNRTQLLYAAATGATWLLCTPDAAAELQKVADTYLLNAKVIAMVEDTTQIEPLAAAGIDGVWLVSRQ